MADQYNKNYAECVVIRDDGIYEGNRKSDGKPFKIHKVYVRWCCNEEQTHEIIPLETSISRGDILKFEPISTGKGQASWRLVNG